MWIFINDGGSYKIGYYRPDGRFQSVAATDEFKEAMRIVNYLNGGDGRVYQDVIE